MPTPTRGILRGSRILALVILCVSVTVGGHLSASGHVSMLGLSLVAILMAGAALVVTARELSFAALLAFAGGSQIVAHTLLGWVAGSNLSASADAGAMTHHGVVMQMSETAQAAHQHMSMTPAMFLSHVVACVVVAALLRSAERTAFSLHRVVAEVVRLVLGVTRIPTLIARVLDGARGRMALVYRPDVPLTSRLLVTSLTRRGPPFSPVIDAY